MRCACLEFIAGHCLSYFQKPEIRTQNFLCNNFLGLFNMETITAQTSKAVRQVSLEGMLYFISEVEWQTNLDFRFCRKYSNLDEYILPSCNGGARDLVKSDLEALTANGWHTTEIFHII